MGENFHILKVTMNLHRFVVIVYGYGCGKVVKN